MSSCRTSTGCSATAEAAVEVCPSCGEKGTTVEMITLKALLTPDGLRRGVPPNPRFCTAATCDVVYFDNSVPVVFRESELVVPVHAKHPDDADVPVCYCFGYTPGSIRDELKRAGKSSAMKAITAEVKAGHCACEVKNPKGVCCLGDVSRVERSATIDGEALSAAPQCCLRSERTLTKLRRKFLDAIRCYQWHPSIPPGGSTQARQTYEE